MSTSFAQTLRFNATPAAVLPIFWSPEYIAERAASVARFSHMISSSNGNNIVTFNYGDTLPEATPKMIRKLLGESINFVEVTRLPQVLNASGSATGTIDITVQNQPATIHATSTLLPTATGCRMDFEGELKIKVPLIGGEIEKYLVKFVPDVFEEIGRLVKRCLDQ